MIPYSLELTALRRITPRLFGILMSLEPAAAALAAIIVLRECLTHPVAGRWLCVVAASWGRPAPSPPPLDEPRLPD